VTVFLVIAGTLMAIFGFGALLGTLLHSWAFGWSDPAKKPVAILGAIVGVVGVALLIHFGSGA